MRRIRIPHWCILLFACWFFDKLRGNESFPSGCRKSPFEKNSAQKVFARLFQKGGGVWGKAPVVLRRGRNFSLRRAQEGRKTSRWDVLRWGTLAVYSTMTKVTDRAKTKVTENDTLKAGINAKGSGNICLGENEY